MAEYDIVYYKWLQSELNKYIENNGLLFKKIVYTGIKHIFDKFTDLNSFSWTQYCPAFNDGDPCRFSVDTYEIKCQLIKHPDICELPSDDDEDDEDEFDLYEYSKEARNAIKEFIDDLDETHLETVFGTWAKVTIYRDGKIEIGENYCDY